MRSVIYHGYDRGWCQPIRLRNFKAETFYPLEGVPAWDALPKEPAALASRLADPALRAELRIAAAAREARCLWDELLVKRVARAVG